MAKITDAAIGRIVHRLMWDRRITQRELGERLGGMAPNTVSGKIRGRRSWSAVELIQVAEILGVSVLDLIPDSESPPEDGGRSKDVAGAGFEPATSGSRARLVMLPPPVDFRRITGRNRHDPTVDLPAVRVPRRLPRPATEAQLIAGRSCGDPDTELMVRLAGNCGLRRSEIAALRREDLTPWG